MNKNIAVFGAQYGDEAKARSINWLSKDFEIIVRISGGQNAGHTFYHNGIKIVRHQIPSADFSIPTQKAFLASGMVINLESLLEEVKKTEELFPGSASRIIVDPDAFVVLPKHIEEDKAKNKEFGSTNQGITPAYVDKIGRRGTKIRQLIQDKADVIQALQALGVQFKYSLEMYDELLTSKIIFEGAQSVMLEYNHGNYPFVTSGECSVGGIYNAGFAFCAPTKVYGVFKPYLTKVDGGVGTFTTEFDKERSEILQRLGGEVGVTTGRIRRVGAIDLVALNYAIVKGGITDLIITKMDILNGDKSVQTCTAYKDLLPFSGNDFNDAKPIYTDLPCWKDASDPLQTEAFLKYIEGYTGKKIEYVSFGTGPKDIRRRYWPAFSIPAQGRATDLFENPEAMVDF